MTNFEMVETLRDKANVTYEEARDALEKSNWDLLDAMLLLEKEGRVKPGNGCYSTKPEEAEAPEADKKRRNDGEGARGALGEARYFPNRDALYAALPELIRPGDCVLVKASHSMAFDNGVEELQKLKL